MDLLGQLLRTELTAVNQQFIHILSLRRLGEAEYAGRIYEVDRVDFPNAMRIIDLLVASGGPVHLRLELPEPGRPLTGLLQSELSLEHRLEKILETCRGLSGSAKWLADTAIAPRAAYRSWLNRTLQTAAEIRTGGQYPMIDPLFACLIAVLEHMMVRAFVAWHAGDRKEADRAWAASGVAMVQATELVNILTDLDAVPLASGSFPIRLPHDLGGSESEQELISAYTETARRAAEHETEPALQRICAGIARYTLDVACWDPGTPHPAIKSCAPSFRSFAATYEKFVQIPRTNLSSA